MMTRSKIISLLLSIVMIIGIIPINISDFLTLKLFFKCLVKIFIFLFIKIILDRVLIM